MAPEKKRIARVVILLIVIAAASTAGYRYWKNSNTATDTLTLYGNVDMREVQLAFMVQDRIAELDVNEGEHVSQGQQLGRLETTRFESVVQELEARLEQARQQLEELETGSRPQEIRKARADVAAAKASLLDTEQRYRRTKELVRKKVSPQQSLDDARSQLDVAKAKLKAAEEALSLVLEGPRKETIAAARANVAQIEALLKRARKDLDDTKLFAPANGVVRSRILEPGDIATPSRPVFTLAKLEPVWIRTYVPETHLGNVVPGMQAKISTDSTPGSSYKGWVGYISPSAEFTPKNVETPALRTRLVYQVWIYACNPDNKLRLGMPATVELDTRSTQADPDASACSGAQ
ncbi:HlyD family secretion protein [Thiogranum longum]|uniref:HlyD family secretion protein n=1 Tax=Thiogranum longum TaxID=1537524 RepID=A0A4R1HBA1_9GAMM|nr:efflux RND transporter periplasmic adaptor subunit [Thiogranum longum]TCK17881.1 HlyD family secretion protein [Thiogranum longum]